MSQTSQSETLTKVSTFAVDNFVYFALAVLMYNTFGL